jgi:hypothetical protein
VRAVVFRGVVIENYPEDVRGHSCLMLGWGEGDHPLHVVCAPRPDYLAVITTNVPSPEQCTRTGGLAAHLPGQRRWRWPRGHLFGYDDDDQLTPPALAVELEGYLDLFKAADKLVLTTDYATTPAHVDDAYAKSRAKGYVPFVTVRDLDRLIINPGHEPD